MAAFEAKRGGRALTRSLEVRESRERDEGVREENAYRTQWLADNRQGGRAEVLCVRKKSRTAPVLRGKERGQQEFFFLLWQESRGPESRRERGREGVCGQDRHGRV